MLTTVPVLETPRLRLRAHTVADFDDLAATWADPVVIRHIGGRASTPTETWSAAPPLRGPPQPLLGYGYWAAEDRETGRFVGDVGLADFHRDLTPPLAAPEAGWVLAPWAHGRGLATEAVTAALAWADAALEAESTVCIIDVGHAASVRVAEKCGYVARGTRRIGEAEVGVFERGAARHPRTPA